MTKCGYIIALLVLVACHPVKNNKPVDTALPVNDSGLPISISTDMPVVPVRNYPVSFVLDSLPADNGCTYFPRSLNDPAFNKMVNNVITKALKENQRRDNEYYYDIWITSFYISGNLVSMQFTDQDFTEGGAHYNYGYVTLNYDARTKKMINFSDVFNLPSDKAKQDFCNIINIAADSLMRYWKEQDTANTRDLIEMAEKKMLPEDINSNTKFCLKNDSLVFCFSDYDPSFAAIPVYLPEIKPLISKYIYPSAGKAYDIFRK